MRCLNLSLLRLESPILLVSFLQFHLQCHSDGEPQVGDRGYPRPHWWPGLTPCGLAGGHPGQAGLSALIQGCHTSCILQNQLVCPEPCGALALSHEANSSSHKGPWLSVTRTPGGLWTIPCQLLWASQPSCLFAGVRGGSAKRPHNSVQGTGTVDHGDIKKHSSEESGCSLGGARGGAVT